MDPKEYINFSRQILETNNMQHPAAYRSVISRVYYAAYNVCVDALKRGGYKPPKYSAHEKVLMCLKYSGNVNIIAIQSQLRELRDYRNEADYSNGNDSKYQSSKMALSCLGTAERIISVIEAECSDTKIKDIFKSIQEYCNKTNNRL